MDWCMFWLGHALRALMCCCVQVTTLFPHYVQSSMTEEVRPSQPSLMTSKLFNWVYMLH